MITAGIDIGSVSTEMVILKDGQRDGGFMINTGLSSMDAAARVISITHEKTVPISSMCTVFAESEVVSLIAMDEAQKNQ